MNERIRRALVDAEVESYAARHTTPTSQPLQSVVRSTIAWSEHPGYMIDATEAQLLRLLVLISGARRILEIGTFSGYSALAMAEALPADGHIDTLELSREHVAKATEHITRVGESERITIHEGLALDSLAQLQGPYDMAFIDADKSAYPAYYEAVVSLMRPGGLIVADNVLRRGRVLDGASRDPSVAGMREFNDRVVSDPRVEAVMLTVRDGVTLIRVRG
jgi:caffeoyl-CoA O-methyltransferase